MAVQPAVSAKADTIFQNDLMKGKVVFVTGGGSGIGLGICLAFARLGAKVAICGRTEAKLAKAVEAITSAGAEDVLYAKADVRNPDECHAAADAAGKKWGKIDVFVNNAAGNFMSLAEDVSPNAFKTVIDIDLLGMFHMSKAALPWLSAAAKDGSGATLLSISATLYYTAMPFQGHAAAAKAGIDSMTKTLAAEWAEYGIRVVSIAPGPIADTEGGPTGRVFGTATAPDTDKIRESVPIGRYGTTDDIANTAVFLASPAGSFITGTNVVVDGMQWQGALVGSILKHKNQIRGAMKEQRDSRERGAGSKGHAGDTQAKL